MTSSNSIRESPGSARNRSFSCAVGPERRVHGIRDEPRGGHDVPVEAKSPVSLSLRGNGLLATCGGAFDDPMQPAAGEIHEVDLARFVLGEFDDADLGIGQLAVVGHLAAVDPQRPELAGIIIAVDIGAFELGQAVGFEDIATGDGPEIAVGMLHQRRGELARPLLPLGPEGVLPFIDAPAVIATTLDEVDHLPEVLPHLAGPEASLPVEAELPDLSMSERPDLSPGARRVDERIVLGMDRDARPRDDPRRSGGWRRAGRRDFDPSGVRPRSRCRPPSRGRGGRPARTGCSRRCAPRTAIPGGSSRSSGPPRADRPCSPRTAKGDSPSP